MCSVTIQEARSQKQRCEEDEEGGSLLRKHCGRILALPLPALVAEESTCPWRGKEKNVAKNIVTKYKKYNFPGCPKERATRDWRNMSSVIFRCS